MRPLLPYAVQIAIVAFLDVVLTPPEITLWALYLAPIGLATWNLGRTAGALCAAVCVILQIGTWYHAPVPAAILPAIVIYLSRFAIFTLMVLLVGALRTKEVDWVITRREDRNPPFI